jgi:hypothetical protein
MQETPIVGRQPGRVLPVESLRDYFRTSIGEAMTRQGVDVDPHAAHYVVNLLTLFARSEQLYEQQGNEYVLRPLALMLANAADAASPGERNYCLQRIGDVSLFIAGFFADGLASAVVDVDYYVRMGGSAYGSLSEEVRGTVRGRAFAGVFRELAAKFQLMVDVLNEVRDSSPSEPDLLRIYEVWLKTGSRRAERLLREHDVLPVRFGDAGCRH